MCVGEELGALVVPISQLRASMGEAFSVPHVNFDGISDTKCLHCFNIPWEFYLLFPLLFLGHYSFTSWSVLWMGLERNKPIWQSAVQLGKLGTCLLFLLCTCRINYEPMIISPGTKLCNLGGDMIQQSQTLLYLLQHMQFYLFIYLWPKRVLILLLQKYGLPQRLSYLWIIKLVVSRDSQATACSNWSWLMGYYKIHCQDQILSAYSPMRCLARFLLGFWQMVLDPTVPLKALLFLDKCWIFVFEIRDVFCHMMLLSLWKAFFEC